MLDDLAPFRARLSSDDGQLLLWCHTGRATVLCDGTFRLVAGECVLLPSAKDAALTVAPESVVVPVRLATSNAPGGDGRTEVFAPGESWNDWALHQFMASVTPLRGKRDQPASVVGVLNGVRTPTDTPALPRTAAVRRVAQALLRDPACGLTAGQWAARVRAGERTLHRAFVAETGRTFASWRRECRLQMSLPLLETGATVSEVAETVGFGTPTGFIRAFRRRFGRTPAVWRDSRHGPVVGGRSLMVGPPTWGAASSPAGLDHGFHLLLWVFRGSMRLTVGDRVLEVGEGQVAWMPAYVGHGVQTAPDSVVLPLTFTVGEVVFGDGPGPSDVPEYAQVWLLQHVMANQCGLGPAGYSVTRVLDEPWVPGCAVSGAVGSGRALTRAGRRVEVWNSPEVAVVADTLLRDLTDARSVSRWAESVGTTSRRLNNGFRAATGMTFLQWRTVVRLETARRMLSAGATPSDAARAVGYRHLSQFSREFSARYGVGPRAFAGSRAPRSGVRTGNRTQ